MRSVAAITFSHDSLIHAAQNANEPEVNSQKVARRSISVSVTGDSAGESAGGVLDGDSMPRYRTLRCPV